MEVVTLRAFEGLFVRALEIQGPALEAVIRAGFDPAHPKEKYEAQVWNQARVAVCEVMFPHLSLEEAQRTLGRLFTAGFSRTVVGRVLATAAPMLGAERVLSRLPFYMRVAREDVEVTMEALGPRNWRATFEEDAPMPAFACGALESILALTREEGSATVIAAEGRKFVVDIRW